MRLLFCLALVASPAGAQGLMGRDFTFQIETYDNPAVMLYQSQIYEATVGDAVELGLQEEGKRDIDLVPVIVDVSADRILLDYRAAEPGGFYKARFNGYIIDLAPGCPEISAARIDPAGTTLGIGNKRVRVVDGRLMINVSDLSQDRDSRLAIDLTLTPCG